MPKHLMGCPDALLLDLIIIGSLMLLAILERRLGMDFGAYDAYVNVVGGMRVTEPAADLAVAAALVSRIVIGRFRMAY